MPRPIWLGSRTARVSPRARSSVPPSSACVTSTSAQPGEASSAGSVVATRTSNVAFIDTRESCAFPVPMAR